MIPMDFLIGAITSFIGTLGFALIVRIRPKYLLLAALGGLLTYAAWYVCDFNQRGIFICNFVGAMTGAIYSEILARVLKTPAIEFSLASVISLAPGSFLYYAMSSFVKSDYASAFDNMLRALTIGSGIAMGMICVSIIPILFKKRKSRIREQADPNSNK